MSCIYNGMCISSVLNLCSHCCWEYVNPAEGADSIEAMYQEAVKGTADLTVCD